MAYGFEKVPTALIDDANVSLNAVGLYVALLRLAYQAGRRKDGDAVALPSLREIGKQLDVAEGTIGRYLHELKGAGWVRTMRAGRRTLYAVKFDRSCTADFEVQTDSSDLKNEGAMRARGNEKKRTDASPNGLAVRDLSDPPSVSLVGGRNLGWDALADVCGIAARSPRAGQIAAGLNGSRAVPLGIREQFWAEATQQLPASLIAPEEFERQLAAAIYERAQMYRKHMERAMLTPTALARWWTDLPTLAAGRADDDLAARMMQHAHQLRQEGR